MLNHIVLMGRLTRDPELRYTQSQTPVASFRLAVERDFGGRDGGERQTDFIDVSAWRSTAEFVSKYFTKGSMAVVSGRLQSREWTDRDNNKRTSFEVVADNVYFGESRRSREENGGSAPRNDSYAPRDSYQSRGNNSYQNFDNAPAASAFSELNDTDGELPF
jgi:single-strand DNA-binding protein